MVSLMSCGVDCLQLLLLNHIELVARLAKVEVKTVITLVAHLLNRHLSAPIALHILLDCIPWLNYQFDTVLIGVSANFNAFKISRKVTILAKRKMIAVSTYETASNDGPHVA